MQTILTSPFTLLLILTIITIWYFEKSQVLEYVKLPYSIANTSIGRDSISLALRTNPRAAIYYEINGRKKSLLADYEGYAWIYHFFDTDKVDIKFYSDKYQTLIDEVTFYHHESESDGKFKPRMVFDEPYHKIAKNTSMNYFIEDDYILVDIKTVEDHQLEAIAYVNYLIDDFRISLDLLKEENNIYQIIYRINDRVVEL